MDAIAMVDLEKQYLSVKPQIDAVIQQCILEGAYINGKQVAIFERHLANYTGIKNVIGCGNGTDALKLAILASELPKGSKIIIPAFTYIAPIEMACFLGYDVVFCDVEVADFNVTLEHIKAVFTEDVKAVIIVHLFGQPCKDTDAIYQFCKDNGVVLIEDNSQSLGAEKNIERDSITTTSFYPTKNLGAFGDAGAILCNDNILANKIRKIASHGQSKKYIHDVVGINSRLDTIQAAILDVKLKHLDEYNLKRRKNATYYLNRLSVIEHIVLPEKTENHIFHLFTIKVKNGKRDALADFLKQHKIDTVVNYPMVAYQQKAYLQNIQLPNSEALCASSLSIPVYPEISESQLSYICDCIEDFCKTI
jgi:UDP-2-acetamido-2-deoxy-ribo-hexuluronate aminotransferase